MRLYPSPKRPPEIGSTRTRTFFAWLPVRIPDGPRPGPLVWLERVTVIERCEMWGDYYGGDINPRWFIVEEVRGSATDPGSSARPPA